MNDIIDRISKKILAYDYRYDPEHQNKPEGQGWNQTSAGWSKNEDSKEDSKEDISLTDAGNPNTATINPVSGMVVFNGKNTFPAWHFKPFSMFSEEKKSEIRKNPKYQKSIESGFIYNPDLIGGKLLSISKPETVRKFAPVWDRIMTRQKKQEESRKQSLEEKSKRNLEEKFSKIDELEKENKGLVGVYFSHIGNINPSLDSGNGWGEVSVYKDKNGREVRGLKDFIVKTTEDGKFALVSPDAFEKSEKDWQDKVDAKQKEKDQKEEEKKQQAQAWKQKINDLSVKAKTEGKKQLVRSYVSDGCHQNLEDCSFDTVYVWVDGNSELSETYKHNH